MSGYGGDEPSSSGGSPPPPQWAPPGGQAQPPGYSYPGGGQFGSQGQFPGTEQAPAGPWSGYGAPDRPPAPTTNGFAVASLVLGILASGFALSIIFGVIALRQIKRTGQAGKGMAVAGVILGVLWIVGIVGVVLLVVASEAERDQGGTISNAGDVMVTDLAVGDCLNGLKEQAVVLTVDGVPCSGPHEAEVYASVELPDGDWPGMEDLSLQADQKCADNLAENYEEAYEDDAVGIFYFHPTSASWREGDREVLCVATYDEGPRTGSLQD